MRYMIDNRLENPESLKAFDVEVMGLTRPCLMNQHGYLHASNNSQTVLHLCIEPANFCVCQECEASFLIKQTVVNLVRIPLIAIATLICGQC
ncbi:hypothetical protein BSPWISOXPB_9325 [uncultured Gammaproteobacteria bacterium]|nr:hypothetical protein BSPWISOXPB_9325 [uncultured Gammaproteobacteria bacterium]